MSFSLNNNLTNLSEILFNKDACKPGLLLPVWMPQQNLFIGDTIARSIVYGMGLAYLFLGVSIIADRFMAAIEVITSQEKEIHMVDSDGNKQVVMVRYWNETVSNLTVIYLNYFISLGNLSIQIRLKIAQDSQDILKRKKI